MANPTAPASTSSPAPVPPSGDSGRAKKGGTSKPRAGKDPVPTAVHNKARLTPEQQNYELLHLFAAKKRQPGLGLRALLRQIGTAPAEEWNTAHWQDMKDTSGTFKHPSIDDTTPDTSAKTPFTLNPAPEKKSGDTSGPMKVDQKPGPKKAAVPENQPAVPRTNVQPGSAGHTQLPPPGTQRPSNRTRRHSASSLPGQQMPTGPKKAAVPRDPSAVPKAHVLDLTGNIQPPPASPAKDIKNHPPAPRQMHPSQLQPPAPPPPAGQSSTPLSTGLNSPGSQHPATQPKKTPAAAPLATDTHLVCTSTGPDNSYLTAAVNQMATLYPNLSIGKIQRLPCPAEYKDNEDRKTQWEQLRHHFVKYVSFVASHPPEMVPPAVNESYQRAFNNAFLDFLGKVKPESLSTFFTQNPLAEGAGTKDDPLKFTPRAVNPEAWMRDFAGILGLDQTGTPGGPAAVTPTNKQGLPASSQKTASTDTFFALSHEQQRENNCYMSAAMGYMTGTYSPDFIRQLSCPADYKDGGQKEQLWEKLRSHFSDYLETTKDDGASQSQPGTTVDDAARQFSRTLFEFMGQLKPLRVKDFYGRREPPATSAYMKMADPDEFMLLLADILGLDQPGKPGVFMRDDELASSVDLYRSTPETGTGWNPGSPHGWIIPESCHTLNFKFIAPAAERSPEDRWDAFDDNGKAVLGRSTVEVTTSAGQQVPYATELKRIIAYNKKRKHYILWYKSARDLWSVRDTLGGGDPRTQSLAEVKKSMKAEGFYPTEFSRRLHATA